mgnify:CR=1 FL=1
MKYLVAVRNSPCSEAMFQKLVGMVDKERDLLFFCCVIPKASHTDKAIKERLALQYRERANDLISSYRVRAQELGIRHTGTVLVGDARSVLLYVTWARSTCLSSCSLRCLLTVPPCSMQRPRQEGACRLPRDGPSSRPTASRRRELLRRRQLPVLGHGAQDREYRCQSAFVVDRPA